MSNREVGMILAIVLREMCAYGQGWRLDWHEFDGRMLRDQLNALKKWATASLAEEGRISDYDAGSAFEREQEAPRG